jgi:hypothetical protein
LHGTKLQRELIPIARHWVQIHRDYLRDAAEQFPKAAAFAVVPAHVSAEFSRVWFCAQCRASEAEWCDRNPDIAPNKDYDREPPPWAYE